MKNKLTNFPPVYYISLSDSINRQQSFENQFLSNEIVNVKMIEAYDGRKINYCIENDTVDGVYFHQMDSGGIAAAISHLKAIGEWYNSSDSEYAIFFEDDMSIQSVDDWNFSWQDFVSALPKNWKAIQLSLIKEHGIEDNDMKLNQREWWNWSAGSYLIRRNYAKELIEYFYQENKYYLKIKDYDVIPCIEYCLFSLANMDAYTIPLFYENTNFVSTFYQHFIEQTHKGSQIDSSNYVKYWWKIKGRDKNLDDLNLKVLPHSNTINHICQNSEFGEEWFSYPNLYKSMVEKFPSGSKFVEVGSWKGKSSAYMAVEIANSNKNIDFYCVDTWEGSIEHKNNTEISMLYDIFLSNMKPVESYYTPLKMKSLDAVSRFGDHSLDFVFIDGSHEYEDVKEDIKAWLPKVKPGGILAGHDYYIEGTDWFPGVKQAVNEELSGFETAEKCWIFQVPNEITITEKLKNFPSVNFISIEESQERRDVLYEMFEKYGISNVTPHIYKRYSDEDHKIIEGPLTAHISNGPVTSHLKAIREWYESTDEEYTIICEDDFTFDTVKYWNFTWDKFFNSLPENWNIVQLCLIREDMFCFFNPEVKLRDRCWCDWSCCAYLISRKHAENLIKNYYPDDYIHLEYKGTDKELREREGTFNCIGVFAYWFCLPSAENIIYSPFEGIQGGIYTFPLFVENVSFNSTWSGTTDNWLNVKCHDEIMNWWKTKGQNKNLEDFKL
jgi:GR25 family glycosyltransferase involved in LPS biosynthesis/predicted O-methyltransferase YrrM